MAASRSDDSPPHTLRLPRDLEADPVLADVRAALQADVRPLWAGATFAVPVIPLTSAVRTAIAALGASGRLVRGLEAAAAMLAAEQRGLAALAEDVRRRQGARVSRVLLVTDDGAERFYRQVERLALGYAPRVLVCRLACTSEALGELAFGAGAVAKLVASGHKRAASGLLRAFARR